MLEIEKVAIRCCAEVAVVVRAVERRDAALADQLRRAMASVAMNVSEGRGSQGGNRRARWWNAFGSAREVEMGLEVARAFGYVDAIDARPVDGLDRIRATLWRMIHW